MFSRKNAAQKCIKSGAPLLEIYSGPRSLISRCSELEKQHGIQILLPVISTLGKFVPSIFEGKEGVVVSGVHPARVGEVGILLVFRESGFALPLKDSAGRLYDIETRELASLLSWGAAVVKGRSTAAPMLADGFSLSSEWRLGDEPTPFHEFFIQESKNEIGIVERVLRSHFVTETGLRNYDPAAEQLVIKAFFEEHRRVFGIVRKQYLKPLEGDDSEISGLSVAAYNYIIDTKSAATSLNRNRWVVSFPAFWGSQSHPEIGQCIDQGQSFSAAFSKVTDTSPAVIKRYRLIPYLKLSEIEQEALQVWEDEEDEQLEDRMWQRAQDPLQQKKVPKDTGLFYEQFRSSPGRHTYQQITPFILNSLTDIPPNKLPSDAELHTFIKFLIADAKGEANPERLCGASKVLYGSWRAATEIASRAGRYNVLEDSNGWLRLLVSSTKGDWDAVARKCGPTWLTDFDNLDDFFRSSSKAIILPQMLREMPTEDLGKEKLVNEYLSVARERMAHYLLIHRGLNRVLEFSREWHGLVQHEGVADVSFFEWIPWTDPVQFKNGIRCVPLVNSSDLTAEGRAMHHCVGGYSAECITGKTQIYSIRDAENCRLSTLQVSVQGSEGRGTLTFHLTQNRALLNNPPCWKARQAGTAFVKALNEGRIKHRVIEALRNHQHAELGEVCGFDYSDDSTWEKAREMFSCYLTAEERAMKPQQFAQKIIAASFALRRTQSTKQQKLGNYANIDQLVNDWLA